VVLLLREERNLVKLTRYPDDPVAFLKSLRTVRFFERETVSQEALDDILEVARWSGSARNRQPWKFLVMRDRPTLKKLAALEGYAKHLAGAAVGIVLVMKGDPAKFEQETFDEGRLAERISLAAASHGLGAAVGWFAGEGRGAAKRILGIPDERVVRTALSLGYPAQNPPRGKSALPRGRKPLADLVYEEHYGNKPDLDRP
jgi:nitroreductase